MYAIIEIAGQQFRIEKDQKIIVHRLEQKVGSQIDFESVLLLDNDKNVLIGEPLIKGARIVARVLSHTKGDKIRIFKKKKRKGYQVLNGHRQKLTEIMIEEIMEKSTAKETHTAETEKGKSAVADGELSKPAVIKETTAKPTGREAQAKTSATKKVSAKKAPGPETEEEKPAVKKAGTKKPAPKATEGKTTTVKSAGTKKTGGQKTDEKKAVAKKTEVKKTGTKKKNT